MENLENVQNFRLISCTLFHCQIFENYTPRENLKLKYFHEIEFTRVERLALFLTKFSLGNFYSYELNVKNVKKRV